MDKKRILIVDDEPSVRLLVSGMLGKEYIVIEANDGEEAIDITQSWRPDLIFMDIMMPNMDGYTACNRIKTELVAKAPPIVMLTAVGYELNKKLAEEVGADGYITKPFNSQELLETATRFLANHE
jgi:two-component system alkaline phosphatase synthesis response regulator PhoP